MADKLKNKKEIEKLIKKGIEQYNKSSKKKDKKYSFAIVKS